MVRGFDKNVGATVVEFLQNYSEFASKFEIRFNCFILTKKSD